LSFRANMLDEGRVCGRTFVVTGGASGLGAAAAQVFHSAGAQVVLVDRNAEVGTSPAPLAHLSIDALCVRVCVCACVRACVRACQEGQRLSEELNAKRPNSAIFCEADITSEEAVKKLIADARKAFGSALPPNGIGWTWWWRR